MASTFLNTNSPTGLLWMKLQCLWAKNLKRQLIRGSLVNLHSLHWLWKGTGYLYFGNSSGWKESLTSNHHKGQERWDWTCFRHVCSVNEKAWFTHAVIRKWVDLMLPLVLRGGQRGLLVWDSASTHHTKDKKLPCRAKNRSSKDSRRNDCLSPVRTIGVKKNEFLRPLHHIFFYIYFVNMTKDIFAFTFFFFFFYEVNLS